MDTYDTIDWLLEHIPNHNGKVGQWGITAWSCDNQIVNYMQYGSLTASCHAEKADNQDLNFVPNTFSEKLLVSDLLTQKGG